MNEYDRENLQRERRNRLDKKMEQLPKMFARARLNSPKKTDALRRAMDYFNKGFPRGQCLLLTGKNGIGKTYAAAALFLAAADTIGRFEVFPELCRRVLDFKTQAEAVDRAVGAGILVLDDFGCEYRQGSAGVDGFLHELILQREANYRATVITTNLTPPELRERFSQGIIARLNGSWGVMFEVDGENLRTGAQEGDGV